MLYLDENESFSMSANVEAPGPQRMALSGYLVRRERNGTYIAPLLPQMFYGVDGAQLRTWRQDLPAAGEQVILSRAAGGYPEVPPQDIAWRKVREPTQATQQPATQTTIQPMELVIPWQTVAVLAGIGLLAYLVIKNRVFNPNI